MQSGPFFPNSGHFFRSLKRAGKTFPFVPNCASVSLAEYALISLNVLKYLWKRLNKLLWLYQSSEYSWSSYMFNTLLKMAPVLNKPGFWLWHGCICKSYAEFQMCLIMAPYVSIMLEYASVYLIMTDYCWISLNICKNVWIYCFEYTSVLNMPRHNNIIIFVTNKLLFLTTVRSELSRYLNEQLDVFLNVKQQKWS